MSIDNIKEFSQSILDALGSHYKEHIYVNAMDIHLRQNNFLYAKEVIVPIEYLGVQLGYERADIVIYEPFKCVIEFKSQTQTMTQKELNQLIKYKKNLKIDVGILINFGNSNGKLEFIIHNKESNNEKNIIVIE